MRLDECIEFIKDKHKNQKRKHGAPYYLHPLEVSNILKEKGFSLEYQVVGLFHDLLEDTDTTFDDIKELSNDQVLETVKLLTKEDGYVMSEYMDRIEKNHIARMVKLADRIHNLSEAHLASVHFQERYIKETEEWFINLANGTVFEEDLAIVLKQQKELLGKDKAFCLSKNL